MKHYDVTQWVDFARGLSSVEQRSRMQKHLDEGCRECQLTVFLFTSAARTGRQEHRYIVPPDVLLAAINAFPAAVSELEESVFTLPKLVAVLLFNSFTDPLPAGARSHPRGKQQLIYESGNYIIDLQLDDQNDTVNIALAGQILNRISPDMPIIPRRIYLISGSRLMAQTLCNDLGEFCVIYPPARELRLRVPLPESNAQIDVPLSPLGNSHA